MCSLCFCIGTHILLLGLSEIQAASIYNFGQHFSDFNPVLFLCLCPCALCQCNRTRAGLQNDRLAPLVQSELLIRFSVRLTFVNTRRATPAFPKRWFVTSKHFIFLPPFLWFRFILCNFISKTKKHKEKQSCMVTICVFSVIAEVCRYATSAETASAHIWIHRKAHKKLWKVTFFAISQRSNKSSLESLQSFRPKSAVSIFFQPIFFSPKMSFSFSFSVLVVIL